MDLQLLMHDQFVNIIIEDNGKGFIRSNQKRGIGLSTISSRVELLEGTVDIDSVRFRGTVLNIDIPMDQEKEVNIIA